MLARRLLMAGGGSGSFPAWTRGTLSAGGSPATVLADGSFNSQPGIAWLDATRVLVVFSNSASYIRGIIGTVNLSTYAVTWGSAFTIYGASSNPGDCVSVIDNQVVITSPLYSTVNHDPFIIICNDPPASLTSSSTWGTPVSVHGAVYSEHNLTIGRVLKLLNGTYLVGYYGKDVAANDEVGVLLSSSLTDWSARSHVVIGAVGAHNYAEPDVEEMPDGTLVCRLRSEVAYPQPVYIATSADHGATWTGPASAYNGFGFPDWRRLTTGLQLTVYRQATVSGLGPTYWRQSADDGATWSTEMLLDGTLIGGQPSYSAYATILQLDTLHALCIYSIGDQRGGAFPANLYSQVFTDSSTR